MRPFTLLFLIFLTVPIAEIYLLIEIGEVIGALWTVAGVVATALIGAWMVRIQGIQTAYRAAQSMRRGETPAYELIEGLFLLVAAALLITPGFVTDTIGFLCLTPAVRRNITRVVLRRILANMKKRSYSSSSASKQNYIYDATYRETKDD